MNTERKTARIVGALYLFLNVAFLLGAFVLLEPILSDPDYLILVSENRTRVVLGVLLELANGIAVVGIAVLMFPILRQRFPSMALGYVAFKIVEFVMTIMTGLGPFLLLTLSEIFVRAGAPEASYFQTTGTLLLDERLWAFQMLFIAFSLAALMFYYMLYQTKLIPRFISIWGLLGTTVVFAQIILDTFGIPVEDLLGDLGVIMLLNELFLGVWLIVKGFNPSAIASLSAKPDTSLTD